MAKRGGFPGGGMPGNMNNLMKQAQRMQRQMEEQQKELEEKEFTASAGGGAVEVTLNGKYEVTKISLDEEVVDPEDIEMLEDLVMAAVNSALRQVEEASKANMSKLTGVFRKAVTCSKLPFIMLTCSIASDTFINGATNPSGTTKDIKNTGSESVPSM